MSDTSIDTLLAHCASLRRGHVLLRDAEMRQRGATEHQVFLDSVELAGLQSSVREISAFQSRTRDWSWLERIVALTSVVGLFTAALFANVVAFAILSRTLAT
jgi:hypothetical protein